MKRLMYTAMILIIASVLMGGCSTNTVKQDKKEWRNDGLQRVSPRVRAMHDGFF